MVRDLAARGIRPGPVLEAMRLVPREVFLPEALRADAYADASLPIGEDQTISQPWIVARMTELLDPDGTGRVLEIGTGSGYQAAILAQVFEQVYTVERSPLLSRRARAAVRSVGIENVHFKIFDGGYGWSEFAPYRAAVVTAAVPQVPAPVLEQVADGGCLVLPLAVGGAVPHVLTRLEKRGAEVVRSEHGPCRFVPLLGKYGWNPVTP